VLESHKWTKPPGEIFAGNAHLGARISCYLVLFILRIWQNLQIALCACFPVENSKQKNSLDRGKETNKPEEESKDPFLCKHLSESYEDSLSSLYFDSLLCSSLHLLALIVFTMVLLPLASLPVLVPFSPIRQRVKNVLQCDAFPRKSWSFVIDARMSCCSFDLRFHKVR